MQGNRKWVYGVIVSAVIALTGCATPLILGGAAMTGGTGTYLFINGELKTDYQHPFEKVWEACEKTVAHMNSVDVVPEKEISRGTINAVIDGQKVRFTIEYKAKELTSVAVRVGMVGDRRSSQLLHDKVVECLQG